MASFQEFANKKILGVKAIYLVALFVVILGVVAWKMKPSKSASTDTSGDQSSDSGAAPTPNPYDSLDSNGTVTVQQLGPQQNTTPTVETNEDWVREGVNWLVEQNKATGTVAYAALTAYINGTDRSYDQEQLVNAWIKEHGAPPQAPATGGNVGAKPVTRQITNLPGYHTVTGNLDDSYGEIATLYYGHAEQGTIDLLQAANTNLGQTGPFAVGTKIYVPVWHDAVYYTVPYANMKTSDIAAKNGVTAQQIAVLNNVNRSNWAKGARVRVK